MGIAYGTANPTNGRVWRAADVRDLETGFLQYNYSVFPRLFCSIEPRLKKTNKMLVIRGHPS